ncbi:hypothetical protein HanRHA438_Chr13g0586821 [Helianthus annuus]|uniref:Uncharacterized protein n=1 Tax=Helianthus annuus TaxID=4232 RepID=A0A9K3EFC3_HELAN|nr:hypothetical protein HanXRQr2_Chr13g0576041 [Helianthus annuus]KAJ0848199.1 hypothetical protein HanPSC8_Chr13g0554361 [Helianthus annuus]KAJ0857159.1 hypothetical protein HanRHA438_Chr13g0586821 [Helianthus annuus]
MWEERWWRRRFGGGVVVAVARRGCGRRGSGRLAAVMWEERWWRWQGRRREVEEGVGFCVFCEEVRRVEKMVVHVCTKKWSDRAF